MLNADRIVAAPKSGKWSVRESDPKEVHPGFFRVVRVFGGIQTLTLVDVQPHSRLCSRAVVAVSLLAFWRVCFLLSGLRLLLYHNHVVSVRPV